MALEPRRIVWLGRRERMEVAVAQDVDPVLDAATQEGLRAVDACVEKGNRDAAAVEARQRDFGAVGCAAHELVLGQVNLLFAVLVLQMLTNRMRATFGHTDLDELRELRD